MYFPFSLSWSHLYLTASQIAGTSCHSSIVLGNSPSKTKFTSISARCFSLKLSTVLFRNDALFEWLSAVHVFPHHFGPSMLIAPKIFRYSSIFLSINLSLYSFLVNFICKFLPFVLNIIYYFIFSITYFLYFSNTIVRFSAILLCTF